MKKTLLLALSSYYLTTAVVFASVSSIESFQDVHVQIGSEWEEDGFYDFGDSLNLVHRDNEDVEVSFDVLREDVKLSSSLDILEKQIQQYAAHEIRFVPFLLADVLSMDQIKQIEQISFSIPQIDEISRESINGIEMIKVESRGFLVKETNANKVEIKLKERDYFFIQKGKLYSLEFTAPEDVFDAYEPFFQKVLADIYPLEGEK
jgi:hypothetical protein